MKFYEVATLSISRHGIEAAGAAILDYVCAPGAEGKLLGLWRTIVGQLNQIVVLREFDARPSLAAERERARRSDNPFHCGGVLTGIDMTSFVPFDFFAAVETGARGPLYEMRTHSLKPAGLTPLEDRWRAEADRSPEAAATILAMYAMDGSPRVVEFSSCRDLALTGVNASHPCGTPEAEAWLMHGTSSSLLRPFASSPLS